jgi:hypothetical protein
MLWAHFGAPMFALYGAMQSDRVPGWIPAAELKPPPVPHTPLPLLEAKALGDGDWRFNGQRISERQLLIYIRQAARLQPRPILLGDFSKIGDPAEKHRLQVAIAEVGMCTSEYLLCVDGTKRQYDRARR